MTPASSFGGSILQFVHEAYSCFSEADEGSIDNRSVMRYFNNQLFRYFQPDINGYTLIFLVPPPFSFLEETSIDILKSIQKYITFAAIDFTPPSTDVASSVVSSRSGGFPFATEVSTSNQCSVTYLDNKDLSIYSFHSGWIEYIRGMLDGVIPGTSPDSFPQQLLPDSKGSVEFGIDYLGSIYVVKYHPSMQKIKYVGKCTGVYPQMLSAKEILGQRTTNEITTIPVNYNCAWYEETLQSSHPIWSELEKIISIF